MTVSLRPKDRRSARLADAAVDLAVRAGAAFRVSGVSMRPCLGQDTSVTVDPCSARNLTPGDIILCRREGTLVLHRFLGALPDGRLLTKGDNSPRPDKPCPKDGLIGRLAVISSPQRTGPFRAGVFTRSLSMARGYFWSAFLRIRDAS